MAIQEFSRQRPGTKKNNSFLTETRIRQVFNVAQIINSNRKFNFIVFVGL